MNNTNLSIEQEAAIALAIKKNKPHLIQIEEWAQEVRDGFIEFRIEVRSGRIEKMQQYQSKYWIREKETETPKGI